MGRPSDYTPELAAEICRQIVEGKSLRSICESEEMPAVRSIFYWLSKHPEFLQQYAHAKEAQAEYFAEEILDISDDGRNDWMTRQYGDEEIEVVNHEALQRSRLRVDTRKWLMSKMMPKKYGDRQVLEHAGSVNVTNLTDEELAEKLAAHGVSLGDQ